MMERRERLTKNGRFKNLAADSHALRTKLGKLGAV